VEIIGKDPAEILLGPTRRRVVIVVEIEMRDAATALRIGMKALSRAVGRDDSIAQ
jgi:hypothetical protein